MYIVQTEERCGTARATSFMNNNDGGKFHCFYCLMLSSTFFSIIFFLPLTLLHLNSSFSVVFCSLPSSSVSFFFSLCITLFCPIVFSSSHYFFFCLPSFSLHLSRMRLVGCGRKEIRERETVMRVENGRESEKENTANGK